MTSNIRDIVGDHQEGQSQERKCKKTYEAKAKVELMWLEAVMS